MSSGESDHQGFENSDFHYTLIDRDDSPALADSIRSYLNHFGQEVSIADETEALQDALFFDSTNAILIIPGDSPPLWKTEIRKTFPFPPNRTVLPDIMCSFFFRAIWIPVPLYGDSGNLRSAAGLRRLPCRFPSRKPRYICCPMDAPPASAHSFSSLP